MTWSLINLETSPVLSVVVAPRDKRERLMPGMVAGLMFVEQKRRPELLWVRIASKLTGEGLGVTYRGTLVSDTMMDSIEIGDLVSFGPEHILEWSVGNL